MAVKIQTLGGVYVEEYDFEPQYILQHCSVTLKED